MDVTEVLMADHKKVEAMFQQIEDGVDANTGKKLFNQIYHELSVHTIVEEQVFYPALSKYPDFSYLLKDAYKEHAEAKMALAEIATLEAGSDEWLKKVQKLHKDIKHHVKDEEDKMFPQVREKVSATLLDKVGRELVEAKSAKLDGDLLSKPMAEHFGQTKATA